MANYPEAIKRPFKDGKKLLIGTLLSQIPIINWFAVGYQLANAKAAMRRNYTLPLWRNWGQLFVKGFLSKVIGFIYSLPLVILFIWILVSMFQTYIAGEILSLSYLSGLRGTLIFLIVLFILTSFFKPIAVLRFIEQDRFAAGFELMHIVKRAFTKAYVKSWFIAISYVLLMFVIFYALSRWLLPSLVLAPWAIGVYIFYIIQNFMFFVAGVTLWSYLGEAYAEGYWERARPTTPIVPEEPLEGYA